MSYVNCENQLWKDDHFCGICGAKLAEIEEQINKPKITYIEERPMKYILDNKSVVGLTLFFFMLSLLTIISISIIIRNVPLTSKLEGTSSFVLY